ncbi:winged helix-turn-helix domain-containing protein [Streptomyces canus]|uniref:winged helix-turn-helix domain-containing protein n=1 Tax=Streptomyces canus TaxID=58343 RepID=UPI0033E6730E
MLEQEPAKGPVAHEWPEQTWTLARIKTLIGRRFHKSMALAAIAQLLHRHGSSHQVPARRATERDKDAVTGWVKETWPHAGGNTVAALGAGLSFEDEAWFSMTPPMVRTWVRCGYTPAANLSLYLRRAVRHDAALTPATTAPVQPNPSRVAVPTAAVASITVAVDCWAAGAGPCPAPVTQRHRRRRSTSA